MTKDNTFLVTGGAGFLGSHLVERLLHDNNVICFDNEFRGSFANLAKLKSDNLQIIRGDINNLQDWNQIKGNIDGIFHLAAINGTRFFYEIPDKVLDVNVKGTINALEFLRKNDIKYFCFAGSPESYGIPEIFPTPESHYLTVPDLENPRWSYGASKIIGEIFCANYSRKYGFKCSILRYHNAYGPRDVSSHVIPDLITKILKNEKFTVQGTGEETRSFCYIDDTIDATLLVKNNQKLSMDVFNIGMDNETKIIELIKLLEKISGKKLNPIFEPLKNPGTPRRIPDITKLKKLGFKPKFSLEKGLELTFQWHATNS